MLSRRHRLEAARLYLVCDARRPDLDAFLDAVLGAGVDVVQLRDKQWEAALLLHAATTFRRACDRHGALFVVNDRPDVALASGADGVHLGQQDLPPEAARAMAGEEMILGRSTHSRQQVEAATREPVDYVCAGPVFATPTKPGRPATGTDLIRLAADACVKPWFAIGGIDASNVGSVVAAGARRIVVVRAIADADDPAAAAAALRAAVSEPLLAPGPR